MLRRSARRSGQAPPDEAPAVVSPSKRGRGGGRGRGRGRGKTTADSVTGAADEPNLDDSREEVQDATESMDDPAAARSPMAAAEAASAADPVEPEAPPTEVAAEREAPAEEIGQKEESLNDDEGRREGNRSRNEERMGEEREERRDEGRRGRPDRWEDRNDEYRDGGRRRRSRSREEYDDDQYSDRRGRGQRGGPPGPPYRNHYGGPPPHNDGYGGGPPGPPPPGGGYGRPPWGYGRGRGRGGPPPPFRGGWRGRGDYGGPMGGGGPPHGHPGMMGPPPGWDNKGYDPMGGPPHPPPHMMHMRGPPPPHPSHFGMPPGMPPPPHGHPPPHGPPPPHPHPHAVPPPPSMMGPGGPGVPPPSMVPPLPPGPPPPPAQNIEMENVKTEAEMAEMKEQIARQIAQAREKAAEGREKEEKREEKEEEKSEDKEKRVKQASAMLRAALFRKSTTTAAATTKAAAAAAAAAPAAPPTTPSVSSTSSTPQPVPPPPSLAIPSSIGNSATPSKASPAKKPETKDVFGKDDEGGLFGERKAHLSLPSAADRAEMQLYNDVLNAPHPGNQESPRKAPAPVPPPVSTPAIVVSKPDSDRRNDHSKERRSRSRSPTERSHRGSRSPRRDRSPHDSKSPLRRDRSPRGSRSPRRSPKISPRRGERNRRSRSRSHGRHRSSRSRSKERGGRTRNDSGHHSSSRRASSPSREPRSTRRRGYDLSPVRNSGGRSSHRRRESKSPRRERSKSRERRRSPERSRLTRSSTRREKEDQKERERRRSGGGDAKDEKRRKDERKDSGRYKDTAQESGDEGKENSSPGYNEEEIDRVMEMEDPPVKSAVAPVQMDTVSIDEEKENAGVATIPATAPGSQLRPEPYELINESIFLSEIKDRNDYGGECECVDGECGEPCLLRYLSVECGKSCPTGEEKCTNRRMQQKKFAKVEVFHTGTDKGFGVRALEPIKKGGFIIEYLGEVMTHKMGEKRKKQYAREFPTRRHHYLMTVTDSKNHPFIIDATKYGNPSRFLNHSCAPNAMCDKWSVNRRFRMGFFAKKAIQAGEEITFDYRFQNYGRTLIECACGAPNCRRYLSSKDAAREEEERVKSGRDRSESSSSGDEDEEEEEEEEEEELEISLEERKKLRKQQAILEEAERLIKKEKLTKKKQHELLSAVMIRLTPAHQELRTRLVRLLIASGQKDNEAYRAFLAKNGRTILEKYLTLGVDEDTTVSQYRQLIPLLEALLDLLVCIKQYLDTISGTGLMAHLVPVLQGISNQSEVPDGLVVFEVMHDIVSGIEEEAEDEEEEGEWTKRWLRCTTRAAELADTWQVVYRFSTFKIPKKKEEKEKKESEVATGKPPGSTSMIRSTGFVRTIKTESAIAKGWQSNEKKEWRDRENYSKDRYASADRGGYRKRKWDEDSASSDKLEEKFNAYRKEQEKKREDGSEKKRENHSATNSSDSPSREDDEDMQISPNLDDERRGGEPDAKRTNMGVPSFSPLASRSSSDPPSVSGPSSLHSTPHPLHQQRPHPHSHRPHDPPGLPPGPIPPPLGGPGGPQWAGGPGANQWGWHPAAAGAAGGGGGQWGPQMGYGGYPNGMAPPPTHALSYFNLAPAPGSSLTAELVFWQGAVKFSQHKADEIQHRLDQASQLEQQHMGQMGQMGLLQHTKEAQEAPLLPATTAAAAAAKEEKAPRPNLNDRLAALTGVQIKSGGGEGGGGAKTPPEEREGRGKKPSPPQLRPPSRPSSEEIAAAKSVRTKDGRIILISSIAKYCKVRTEGAMYYYNKITRSPTWILPEGEEANSEDEIEVGPCDSNNKSSASGEGVSTESGGGGGGTSGGASSRSTTTSSAKTPGRGRPQTPPEEPIDPISTHELTEKEKLARKSEFKTRSGELLKRYVKASMFSDVEEFKKTLRKIIHGCIEKEQKMNPHFDFSYSDDVKHRMVEYTKKYVQRHKLKQISYPDGIAD